MDTLLLLALRVSIPAWLAILIVAVVGLVVLYTAVYAFFRPEVLINLSKDSALAFAGQIVRGLPENLQGIGARIVSVFLVGLSGTIFLLAYWAYDRSYGEPNRQRAEFARQIAILADSLEEDQSDNGPGTDHVQAPDNPEPEIEPMEVADVHMATASQAWEAGNRPLAIESAEKALRIYSHHLGPDHPKVNSIQSMLASARTANN